MCSVRLSAAVVVCWLGLANPSLAQTGHVAPYNLVIVPLDASISFQIPVTGSGMKGRIPVAEAIGVVQRLFDASSKQRRRRSAAEDRYVLIAVDAASQVIWTGDRKHLASLTGAALSEMLKVRRQFAYCTDYEAGLNAAARAIRENSDASDIYVLTFGDLVHEPPTRNYRTCAAASGEPPAGIDWEALKYASLGFYFVSTDFKLRPNRRWPEFLEGRGLHADFKDMAQTMTQDLELPPPPAAVYRPTQEQIDEAQVKWTRFKGLAWSVGKGVAGLTFLMVVSMFGFIVFARRRVGGQRSN